MPSPPGRHSLRKPLAATMRRAVNSGMKLPTGVRSLLGILLVVAGLFGFLPILGFWMIPLGAVFVALDFPPLRRKILARLRASEEADVRD